MEKSGKLPSIIVAYGTRSTLPDALVAAYQRAIFAFWWMVTPQTDGPGFVEFKLGDYVEQLDAIFQMTGHDTAALITASNPKGVALSDAENGDRHGLLKRALEQRQLSSVRAYGRDPDSGWKPEDSLLVPGPVT